MPLVEVSVGELLDKWSILEIKVKQLTKPVQLENIQREMAKLAEVCNQYMKDASVNDLYKELLSVNLSIWLGMDDLYSIQNSETSKFITLTNKITQLNKTRAFLKKEIDNLCLSEFSEEKSYF